MLIETFDTHVVIPHLPDWSSPVEWTRGWQNEVGDCLDGSEERLALRSKGRHALRYQVQPYDLVERAALVERLRAAKKSGLMAIPFWGRGMRLQEASEGSETITLSAEPVWAFGDNDPIFFCSPNADEHALWEVRQIIWLDSVTMTLDLPLTRSYPSGWFCWSMILGHGSCSDFELPSDWHCAVNIEVRQLKVRDNPVLTSPEPDGCEIPMTLPGGGDSFDCYTPENPVFTPLDHGAGWTGAWAFEQSPFGVVALDGFDAYSPQDPVTQPLQGGSGWLTQWAFEDQPQEFSAFDSFETYSPENPITQTMSGGDEWDGSWVWEPEI